MFISSAFYCYTDKDMQAVLKEFTERLGQAN